MSKKTNAHYVVSTTEADIKAGFACYGSECSTKGGLRVIAEQANQVHGIPSSRLTVQECWLDDDGEEMIEVLGTMEEVLHDFMEGKAAEFKDKYFCEPDRSQVEPTDLGKLADAIATTHELIVRAHLDKDYRQLSGVYSVFNDLLDQLRAAAAEEPPFRIHLPHIHSSGGGSSFRLSTIENAVEAMEILAASKQFADLYHNQKPIGRTTNLPDDPAGEDRFEMIIDEGWLTEEEIS